MNKRAVAIIVGCLIVLFGVPMYFQEEQDVVNPNAKQVIIITPHNEQIRYEFGRAFEAWHSKEYEEDIEVVWSVPGGTSEIRRMLQSQYKHALETGHPVGGEADLVFGGGSYEHTVLSNPIEVERDGELLSTTITTPFHLDDLYLEEVYPKKEIGDTPLYNSDGYWYGVALSGFGIVYNNHVLDALGIEAPESWEALCNPKLFGHVALVNPAQSGSVTTAFEAILKNLGWERGWQVLRRAAANARYFSASSLKPPADVSQGDAAMGVCIDFYGRYQSQAIKRMGGGGRIGYIDPPGTTMIDPDPISLMRGAPNRVYAERFITFCLTEIAQALWQFKVSNEIELGPNEWELRRLPVRSSMYELHMDKLIDQVNPYEHAVKAPYPDRNMRAFIAPVFSGMAMDFHELLSETWRAIITHPSYPNHSGIVIADDVVDVELKQMLIAFDAMPLVQTPEGIVQLDTASNRSIVKKGWLRDGYVALEYWDREEKGLRAFQNIVAKFFKNQYESILEDVAQ